MEEEKGLPEYLTTGVVAEYCGVSKVTVLRWIKKGHLAAFKLPEGQNRIHINDLREFAARHKIPIQDRQLTRRNPNNQK